VFERDDAPPSSPRTPEVESVAPGQRAPLTAAEERAEVRRALADLDAAKLRLERDARRAEEATRGKLISELLPVLDNLDRTLERGSSDAALLRGVTLIRAQLERVLGTYGLERIDAVGVPFDPALHDAVATMRVSDPAADGLVTEALTRGYRFGGRVLVPARVRVGKLG
jgi:molecular chaperone GrpE